MLVQAENFRKKFRSLPIPHLRVPLKHAAREVSRFKWAVSREEGEEEEVRGRNAVGALATSNDSEA
jgi:hypothetical protein